MQRLVPQVQHYAWGSETALPELLGVEPDGRPWAEMWIGDHPRLPSTIAETGEALDAGLPFLLKILAAAEPLSIQTHPSLEQAVAGYARENAQGLAIDAFDRTYRDANHKPELICALTPFDALVGFRTEADVVATYKGLASMEAIVDKLVDAPDASDEGKLRHVVEWLLRLPQPTVEAMVGAVVDDVPLAALLHSFYPNDRGVLVGLLLNRVQLQPGEAVFLGAGNLHAYLSGVGVEIMANSDNVIRGGLTPKHIDVDELLGVVSFEPFEPDVQHHAGSAHRYRSTGSGFELERMASPTDAECHSDGPELVLVTEGAVQLRTGDGRHLSLGPGEAGFIHADTTYTVEGDGVAWRASGESAETG